MSERAGDRDHTNRNRLLAAVVAAASAMALGACTTGSGETSGNHQPTQHHEQNSAGDWQHEPANARAVAFEADQLAGVYADRADRLIRDAKGFSSSTQKGVLYSKPPVAYNKSGLPSWGKGSELVYGMATYDATAKAAANTYAFMTFRPDGKQVSYEELVVTPGTMNNSEPHLMTMAYPNLENGLGINDYKPNQPISKVEAEGIATAFRSIEYTVAGLEDKQPNGANIDKMFVAFTK